MIHSIRMAAGAAALLISAITTSGAAAQDGTLMLQDPDIHDGTIVFVYAGDLWTVGTDGGEAKRLTSHPAPEGAPSFSPDGQWIAYTANYTGGANVHIIPAGGGQPRQLTWHPEADIVQGWNPDGSAVVFQSNREVMRRRGEQIFQVSVDGGHPEKLRIPQAFEGTYSPDGSQFAYSVFRPAYSGGSGWKRHRGGTTPPVWLIDLETAEHVEIPHENASDLNPVWVGDTVYFISDRADVANIFAYDVNSGDVTQVTDHAWDVKAIEADGETLVYEAGYRLYTLSLAGGDPVPVSVTINADFPEVRPGWKNAASAIEGVGISPSGVRALFSARGDIFTVPSEKGDTRNLTESDGVRDNNALWSPDGQRIAYLTDETGRWNLVITDQAGTEEISRIDFGTDDFYYLQDWSADGGTIIYSDNHLGLYALDVASGETRKIDENAYRISGGGISAVDISPDSRWLAYTRMDPNYMQVLLLHDLEAGETYPVTEGMVRINSPVFSRDGKHLYFTASTNAGSRTVFLDMSVNDRPERHGIYAAALEADGATPLPLESDEEEAAAENGNGNGEADNGEGDGDEESAETVVVEPEGLVRRIAALPVSERFYTTLSVGKDNNLYILENRQAGIANDPPGDSPFDNNAIHMFDFEKRAASPFMEGVAGFIMSEDGSTMLVQAGPRQYSFVETGKPPEGKGKRADLGGLRVHVDPRTEWRQIFDEVVWMERQFFYAPNMHGLDWAGVAERYRPFLDHIVSRADLNTLMIDMIGEMEVGHNRIFGGDLWQPDTVAVGLPGADITVENGRYRIARIFTGEGWHPFLHAPLAVPGLDVADGDYILAVNGQELTSADNFHAAFEGTVDKQTVLTVNSEPTMEGAHDITIKPVSDDDQLRLWTWIEDNRRKVADATDGRVGYLYLPNTAGAGFSYFNRYFFPQIDKDGLIIDERANGGGQAANYIIETLLRPYLGSWKDRDGHLFTTPAGSHYGPKAMLINQYAGSGGDFLPYSFKYTGLGPLIGTRTWGGLIGIAVNPQLIDGGYLSVPYFRFIHPDGTYRIENEGVAPDIEVVQTPAEILAGGDPQLDRAIAHVLSELENWEPVKVQEAPPYPTDPGQ